MRTVTEPTLSIRSAGSVGRRDRRRAPAQRAPRPPPALSAARSRVRRTCPPTCPPDVPARRDHVRHAGALSRPRVTDQHVATVRAGQSPGRRPLASPARLESATFGHLARESAQKLRSRLAPATAPVGPAPPAACRHHAVAGRQGVRTSANTRRKLPPITLASVSSGTPRRNSPPTSSGILAYVSKTGL